MNAQNDIEDILYEHIKDLQMNLLNCDSGHRTTFYFATNGRESIEEKRKVRLQAATCMKSVYGMDYEQVFRKRPDGKPLGSEHEKYKAYSYHIDFKMFKLICGRHLTGVSGNGRIYISKGVANGDKVDVGHTFWFSYSPEGYYIQDSIDNNQGLFKFNDKETFIRALYDQLRVHSENYTKKAYFWIRS